MPRTHLTRFRGGELSAAGEEVSFGGGGTSVLSGEGNHDRLSPTELSAGLRSWPRGGPAFPVESHVGPTGQWATAPHLVPCQLSTCEAVDRPPAY